MKRIFTLLGLVLSLSLNANDISVNNVTLIGQNTSAGTNNAANYTKVQFDLSWDNSWRTTSYPNNWDAAWVFVKYRIVGSDWQHAWLNSTGHTAPSGSTIDLGLQTPDSPYDASINPGIGVFIYRNADGTGTFSPTEIQLQWNYATNGVNDNQSVDIQVFAIEMVYVPQGGYSLGSGGLETGAFYKYPDSIIAYPVSSENEITVGTISGNLYYPSDGDMGGPIPAAFPKGFDAFYSMKYEISQQQYVDFLNTLTREQQNNRTGTNVTAGFTSITNRYVMSNTTSVSNRNGIRCDGTVDAVEPITFYCDLNGNGIGGQSNDGQWIACGYLSYMDIASYLDWSGLRPMTELEYEKSCRGTLAEVPEEYAWGSISIMQAASISNGSASSESSSTAGANVVYNGGVSGPMRVGVFATSSSTRSQSGATFYGIMEMSGNLFERTVTVGNGQGRGFTGESGDGSLSSNGHANVAMWPGLVSGEVIDATGTGLRGGSWGTGAAALRVSDRSDAAQVINIRNAQYGGRGCRMP